MKNMLTSLLIVASVGFASAQKLPPAPPKPPKPSFLKHKKSPSHPSKSKKRPAFVTPDGRTVRPGDRPSPARHQSHAEKREKFRKRHDAFLDSRPARPPRPALPPRPR